MGDGGTVRLGGGAQSKLIVHRHAECREQRASEAAEALLRREGFVPMMMELRLLQPQPLGVRKMVGIADVVMQRDHEQIARPGQKCTNGIRLDVGRLLTRSNRIETDDDQGIDALKPILVEQKPPAVVVDALNFQHRPAGLRARLFHKGGEILLHDVIEEAADALVDEAHISQLLQARIQHAAKFENRREAILDDAQRCTDFIGAAPGIVDSDFTAGHLLSSLAWIIHEPSVFSCTKGVLMHEGGIRQAFSGPPPIHCAAQFLLRARGGCEKKRPPPVFHAPEKCLPDPAFFELSRYSCIAPVRFHHDAALATA